MKSNFFYNFANTFNVRLHFEVSCIYAGEVNESKKVFPGKGT